MPCIIKLIVNNNNYCTEIKVISRFGFDTFAKIYKKDSTGSMDFHFYSQTPSMFTYYLYEHKDEEYGENVQVGLVK